MTSQEVIIAKLDILFLWQNNYRHNAELLTTELISDRHTCFDLMQKKNMYHEIYKHKNWKYDSALPPMINRCVKDRDKQWLNELLS